MIGFSLLWQLRPSWLITTLVHSTTHLCGINSTALSSQASKTPSLRTQPLSKTKSSIYPRHTLCQPFRTSVDMELLVALVMPFSCEVLRYLPELVDNLGLNEQLVQLLVHIDVVGPCPVEAIGSFNKSSWLSTPRDPSISMQGSRVMNHTLPATQEYIDFKNAQIPIR